MLRLPPHNTEHATFMQPFQCDLQAQIQETHRITHTGTTWNNHLLQNIEEEPNDPSRNRRTHTRYLSSPAAANTEHATFMQPFQCDLQAQIQETHRITHTGTTWNNHLLQNTEEEPNDPSRNRRTHEVPFHRRPQPLYTEKHKVSCPGFLPTTQSMQHSCSRFPSSPLPILTTSLRHHFPSSPLPFVTTSLGHHCPSSPPCVIASYSFVMYCYGMLSLRPPCVIASYSFVMYCYVMSSLTPPCVIAYYSFVMYCCAMQKTHTTLHQCQISQFYLSVTRKYCFPTSFDNSIKNTSHPIHRNQIEINHNKSIKKDIPLAWPKGLF